MYTVGQWVTGDARYHTYEFHGSKLRAFDPLTPGQKHSMIH